jgi:DNA-binding LacI/PurR family transcriptional regulator
MEYVNFMDVYSYCKSISFEDLFAKLESEYQTRKPRFRKAAAFVASEYGGHSITADYELSHEAQVDVVRFLRDDPRMDISEYGKLRGAREMLISFLDDRNTAVVFPRDVAARGYLRALDRMSVRVPTEISTLSFDNHLDSTVFPCNTVDFGAEELGYQAFHALSGITPITRNCRDGSIAVVPAVVDRGSVSYLDS